VLPAVMPIFFHLESHLWIIALFFVNGFLFTCLARHWSKSFYQLTHPFEALILSSFFISIGVNSVVLLALDKLDYSFDSAGWPLVALCLILISALCLVLFKHKDYKILYFQTDLLRLTLYFFVFVLLFYNGGLIEQISDAWWHMSLANKIAIESAYEPSLGHLTGFPTRYYPPLWHANLAVASKLSGDSIAVIWNSFTAWGGMLKVMAFYLFAFGLSKKRWLAVLAAILFVLLPGVGVSYLRVSSWPSHIAYTAWYAMFYIFTFMLDRLPYERLSVARNLTARSTNAPALFVSFTFLFVVIFFTHQAELVWFLIAYLSYLIASSLSRNFSTSREYLGDRDHPLLKASYRVMLILIIAYSSWFAISRDYTILGLSDLKLAYGLPVLTFFILLVVDLEVLSKRVALVLALFLLVLVLASINFTHLYSLFAPEFALPRGEFHESSSRAIGYLGGELQLPNWNLQLRQGLLYSGILAVLVSIVMLAKRANRLNILVAGGAVIVLVFCSSPYYYHWLQAILGYHSSWRISIVLFHPIIWASLIVSLIPLIRGRS
jgi:hypothetical protein